MLNYGLEWQYDGQPFVAVAHGDRDLNRIAQKLVDAGFSPRSTRATAEKPIKPGEFVVWEM